MKITGAMKPSALCLLLVLHSARGFSSAAHPAKSSVSINRHFQGDIFTPMGGDCSDPHCSPAGTNRSTSRPMRWGSCQCQCSAQKPIYRDDTKNCVDTVEECMLADYVNGAQSEKVPFVFMPVKGQLINANAEIALSDVRAEGQVVVSPVCVVSKAHYLTSSGWMPTDNSSALDDEPPFALFRDSGRTYLQWLGESRLRSLLEGRVVLVKLLCKDTANARIGVFSPCIAFRVAGSPGLSDTKSESEISLHGPGLDASKDSKKSGLRNTDYLAIGISAGLLGLLYVAVLVVFLCYRRRRRRQNVHVKLTAPSSPLIEQGTIRMNPLLHSRPTLPSGSAMFTQQQPADGSRRHSATPVVHPRMDYRLNSPEQMADRHYYGRGNVTVEMNPASVDAQKRIFFSPTYFDPELFKQAPPPGAVEFLSRIRGMIDTAKGKMTSRRFIPNLIDIPEEHGGYGYGYGYGGYGSAYGSGNLGVHQPAGFDYGHHESIYDTMKRQMASIKKSVSRRSSDEPSSGQSVEYRSGRDTDEDQVEFRPTVNQKSPLPVRGAKNADSAASGVAMYTNPSIDEIYKSLARESHPSAESSPKSSKNEDKIQPNVKKTPADDAVAELVSEAESKVPKVSSDDSDGIQYAPSAVRKVETVRYEQDSLDRSEFRLPGTRQHLYVKKKIRKSAQSNRLRSDPPAESKAAEEIGFVEGYNSSTNTSVKSLSRVLPAEEEMEIGNQLFNKNTGAKTLPRLLKMRRADGAIPEESSRSGETESAESTRSSTSGETVVTAKPPIPKDNKKKSGRIDGLVNRRITVPVNAEIHQSDTQSDPLCSKLTIQVDDQPSAPLTIRTDDSFDADTLEKNQFRTKRIERQESFIDSLERPRTGKIAHSPSSSSGLGSSESSISPRNDPADAKPSSVTPGTVLNLCQIYTAKIERNSWGLQLNDPGAPKKPMKIVSASNPDVQLPKVHATSVGPPPRPPKKETTPAPPLVPDRLLKPAANPPKLPPRNEEVSRTKVAVLPPLPPKNAQGRSTGKTEADQPSTSAPSLAIHPHGTAAPDKQVEKTYNCGQFIMTNQESTSGSSGSSPVSGRNQTLGRKSSTNVLQRIAEIEREEVASGRRIDGVNGSVDTGAMTKGMEIALALRAKMDLEGTLKDNKKSRSIKKTWRKLMDKMEDSCSENEIVSAVSASASAASSIAGTLRLAAKRKKNGLNVSNGKNSAKVNASESDETDSESRSSSLGSDGTGHPDPVEHSTGGVKLKGFYKFRSEDETPESKLVKKSADAPYGRIVRPLNKNHRLKTMRRIDDSFDSGLYSSNYSTYQTSIGDY